MAGKNVILLHADQQRYDSTGCAGNPFARTPNLDALAAEGTLFTRHITSNPVCSPSRASLMTGLYPPGHNVWTNGVPLNRREYLKVEGRVKIPRRGLPGDGLVHEPPTLADVFAAAGYDTAMFGKLHLTPYIAPLELHYPEGWANWQKGEFDDWHGPYYGFRHVEMTMGHGEQPCHTGHYALWLKREHPDVHRRLVEAAKDRKLPVPEQKDLYPSPLPSELHNSMWLANRVCQYLDNRGSDAARRTSDAARRTSDAKPFLLFVGFPDPHHPFVPPADLAADFEGVPFKPSVDPEGEGMRNSPERHLVQLEKCPITQGQREAAIRYTYAMVHLIDRAVGRIVEALKRLGLWDDTIIAFTSDHGDFLGDHGLLYKGFCASDSLVHVPFILRAPRDPQAGSPLPRRVDVPMSNCDVLPTLAGLAGVRAPDHLHGRDIRSVIQDGKEHFAFVYCADGVPQSVNYCVYDESHRFCYYPHDGQAVLYDHRKDPGECRNVAAEPAYHATAARLLGVLRENMLKHYNPILARVGAW